MKYLTVIVTLFLFCSCSRSTHDGVDDEYSRGFLNCLAIVKNRFPHIVAKELPYWSECKRSYEGKQDLYNYWDTSYSYKEYTGWQIHMSTKGADSAGMEMVVGNNGVGTWVKKDSTFFYADGKIWVDTCKVKLYSWTEPITPYCAEKGSGTTLEFKGDEGGFDYTVTDTTSPAWANPTPTLTLTTPLPNASGMDLYITADGGLAKQKFDTTVPKIKRAGTSLK